MIVDLDFIFELKKYSGGNMKNNFLQAKEFLLYLFVGAISTMIEWIFFYLLNGMLNINYLFATSFAFIFSTFVNWFLGRVLIFKNKSLYLIKEIFKIYAVSLIGLFFNLIIMFLAIEKFNMQSMFAKILATGIVFAWNFLIRKYVIYKI